MMPTLKKCGALFVTARLREMPQSLNEGDVSGSQSNASCRTVVFVRMAIIRPSSFRMRRKLHSGVHRRQSILPSSIENRWRPYRREYTRRPSAASSPPQETDPSESVSCDRLRLIKNRHPAIAGCRHVASTQFRIEKVPVSPFVGACVPGTTRWHTHDIRLPCRSVARFPQKLPLLRSSTSTQATLPLYGVLIT